MSGRVPLPPLGADPNRAPVVFDAARAFPPTCLPVTHLWQLLKMKSQLTGHDER
jgi:hypothetical protein